MEDYVSIHEHQTNPNPAFAAVQGQAFDTNLDTDSPGLHAEYPTICAIFEFVSTLTQAGMEN
jgi:hypothetical protein